ncbi:hypothetical protein WJX72_003387 [[Myrmecia] bisecta]|uniref:ARID domain-containing protein n=1 Tax=[Myrmecia] bisecta TaxID=41462 RepID=A0AAW1P8I6_9CHLO
MADVFELWEAVMKVGGFEEANKVKGSWARIGRRFNPPPSMTTLSHRTKQLYAEHLLDFEKAVQRGESDVALPAVEPYIPSAAAHAAAGRPAGNHTQRKTGGTSPRLVVAGSAPPAGEGGPSEPRPWVAPRPAEPAADKKRKLPTADNMHKAQGKAKQVKKPKKAPTGSELLGMRVEVLWPDEGTWFPGTVASYDREKGVHLVHYDDGDVQEEDLRKEQWHLLPDQTPPGFLLAPATLPDAPDAAALANGEPRQLAGTSQAAAAGRQAQIETPKLTEQPHPLTAHQPLFHLAPGPAHAPAAAHAEAEEPDEAPAAAEDPALTEAAAQRLVTEGDGYQVFRSEAGGGYEIFARAHGLLQEEIRVKCWEEGRLLILGTPRNKESAALWRQQELRFDIPLPSRVEPRSAHALLTLHGQLYIQLAQAAD